MADERVVISTGPRAVPPSRVPASEIVNPRGAGRHFPTHTPLGAIMARLGLRSIHVAERSGVHHRTLTEYLAGRKLLLPDHRARIADVLGVDPTVLGPTKQRPVRAPAPQMGTGGPAKGNERAADRPRV